MVPIMRNAKARSRWCDFYTQCYQVLRYVFLAAKDSNNQAQQALIGLLVKGFDLIHIHLRFGYDEGFIITWPEWGEEFPVTLSFRSKGLGIEYRFKVTQEEATTFTSTRGQTLKTAAEQISTNRH